MSETPTNQDNRSGSTSHIDSFKGISTEEWKRDHLLEASSRAAQRLEAAEQPIPLPEESEEQAQKTKLSTKIGIGVAIAGAAVLGPQVVDSLNGPEFPESTTTFTAESGDSLFSAAETVPGSTSVDIRDVVHEISTHPANIEVLKDGLQAGESIEIPTSVEP